MTFWTLDHISILVWFKQPSGADLAFNSRYNNSSLEDFGGLVSRGTRQVASFVALIIVILTGCTPSASTPAPTPDLNLLVQLVAQRAVETVQAQMTQDALAHPSSTPMPTETPPPTATPLPPTPAIPTATTQPVGDRAEFLYAVTYPENRTVFVPNEAINIAWGLKNVGTVTWSPDYVLRYVGGEAFTARYEIPLGKVVPPGEKAEFNFGAFGSEELGKHTTYWQLFNPYGAPVPGGYVSFTYVSQ